MITLDDKTTGTVIAAMAEKIRSLEGDIFMRDIEIGNLRARIAELESKESHHEND